MPHDHLHRFLQQARGYIEIQRWAEASDAAKSALAIEPDHYEARGVLGQSMIGLEQYEKCMEIAEGMIASAPDAEWGFRQKAVALFSLNKAKASLPFIQQALSLDPENEVGLTLLCDIQIKLKEKKDAQATADRLLSIYPDSVSAHSALGEVASARRQWAVMADHAGEVLKRDSENERAIYMLGFSLMQLDRDVEAIDVFHRGVMLYPQSENLNADLKWTVDNYVGPAWPAALISIVVPGAIFYFLWDMFVGKHRRIRKLSTEARAYVRQRLRLRNSLVWREALFLLSTLTWGIWIWMWLDNPDMGPDSQQKWAALAVAVLVSGWSGWSTFRWLKLKRSLL